MRPLKIVNNRTMSGFFLRISRAISTSASLFVSWPLSCSSLCCTERDDDIDASVVRSRLEIAGDLSAHDPAVVCMQFGRAESILGRDRTVVGLGGRIADDVADPDGAVVRLEIQAGLARAGDIEFDGETVSAGDVGFVDLCRQAVVSFDEGNADFFG